MSQDEAGDFVVHATRVKQPIKADGKLAEEAYQEIEPITAFIQQEPHEGAPITERTEAWVMFDDEYIYLSCRCWDEHPERIVANDMRRDSPNLRQNDNFAVALDTFHDRRNGYVFYVSPIGGMFDAATKDERTNNSDWNTVWAAEVGRFDGGWVAEIAIPFKSLRYKTGRSQVWGINLRRTIRAKNEYAFITPLRATWGIVALFRMSAAASLVDLEVPPPAKNLEIKPYAIAGVRTDHVSRPSVDQVLDKNGGMDLKYGLTKSLTLDFTYKTDFAQVEEDEAQVNLTRFNLFLPEKREFFLEGQGTFAFGAGGVASGSGGATGGGNVPTIFYSRRIGLNEGHPVAILGGGRVTGKAGKWNIGALNIESGANTEAAALQTNFTVLRLQRDVLRRSSIGAIFTNRSTSTIAPGSNQVLGLDSSFAFSENVYLSGYIAQSRTNGVREDDLSYRAQFIYTADRYGVQYDGLAVDKNFNPEIGFLTRRNFRNNFGSARFSPRPKANTTIRQYHYESNFKYTTDQDNRLESRELRGSFRTDFQNSDTVAITAAREYEFLAQPFQVADGVRIPPGGYEFSHVIATYSPGQQHRVAGSFSVDSGSFYGGKKTTATYKGRIGITPRLAIEPNLSLNWSDLPQGKFTTTVIGGRTLFTMTPRMFLTALMQYASSTTSLSTNIRFRWEYQPGSELFVVYTEGRDTFAHPLPVETRGFVVKLNRLFRL